MLGTERAMCGLAILGFAATIEFAFPGVAVGGICAPETRAIASSDGNYLLVSLTPVSERQYRHAQSIDEQDRIESTYHSSGLYRNDGTTTLLWPTHYIHTTDDVHVSNDGVHVVTTFLNWDDYYGADRGDAVSFYANGALLASFHERDLLPAYVPRMFSRIVGVDPPSGATAKLDEATKTLELTTDWGDVFRFDITTGKLVESRLPRAFKMALACFAVLCAVGGWNLFRVMSKHKARRTV